MGQTGGYYRRYTCGDHRSGTDIRLRGRSPHGQRHRIRYQTGGDARHQDDDNNRNNQDDVITDTANAQIPSPENLNGTYAADGSSVTFTWTNPDPQSGDTYAWAIVQGSNTDQSAQTVTTSDPTVTVNAQEARRPAFRCPLCARTARCPSAPPSPVRPSRKNDPLATAGHATLALRIASDVRPAAANSPMDNRNGRYWNRKALSLHQQPEKTGSGSSDGHIVPVIRSSPTHQRGFAPPYALRGIRGRFP